MRSSTPSVFLVLAWSLSGCGGTGSPTAPESELPDDPGPLTGRVIATDTLLVPAADTNSAFQQFSTGGTLPADLGPTTGRRLVLSLKDVSRPDIVCTGGTSDSNCVVLEVLERPDEGFVSVELTSGRQTYFLQSTMQLDIVLEPA